MTRSARTFDRPPEDPGAMKRHTLSLLPLLWLATMPPVGAAAQVAATAAPCEPASAGTLTYDALVAKHADPDSKFVVLDGVRVHYKDQGSGPAVLLVHGTFGDLKDWDGWVAVLARKFRVIRLDLPAFGLTGDVPSGNYSVDRYLTLVDSLMDNLGIERFAIVGNSYGGLVAFRYAATRVERVAALVLMNSAGIEYGGRGGTTERPRSTAAVFTPRVATPEGIAANLNMAINDPAKVTPQLVQRKVDYANAIGRDRISFIATQMYERGDPQRVLAHVRAPSLVLWGGASKALSPETAQAFVEALKNAQSTQKIVYEGGGHLLHIERPEATANDALAFIERQFGPASQ
jgi:pimeloyl-ACP methyl ester carboxylesterase